MKSNVKYSFLLILAAMIWGAAFVAQIVGMDYLKPFSFNGIRCFIGALVLAPLAMIVDKKEGVSTKWNSKELIIGGIMCGFFLFLASSSQQIGLVYTSAGKSGFITALYIVMVPVFSLFRKKKASPLVWISVALAVVGLYFLCVTDGFTIQITDLWLFACAILFALQILAVDKFAPNLDVIKLSCYQFAVSGILSIIPIILEKPTMSDVFACKIPILYAGILSCGVAYTLQMAGQKKVEPTVASILMSLESVFSVIFGFLLLHEKLSARELVGCVVMFAAVLLAQINPKEKKDERESLEENR